MVQKYLNTIRQAKRELADFCTDALKQLHEMGYIGTLEFEHCLGNKPLRNAKGTDFRDGGLGLDKLLPSSVIEMLSYSRPFWHDYAYNGGKMYITDRQGYRSEGNRLKPPQTREVPIEDIPFIDFTNKELLAVARKLEETLGTLIPSGVTVPPPTV